MLKIIIEDYNPKWVGLFLTKKQKLKDLLEQFSPAVEHIGSTSVERLMAKPIIDIMVGLNHEEHLDQVIGPMTGNGYTYFKIYEAILPERHLFGKLKPLVPIEVPEVIGLNEEYIAGKEFFSLTHIHVLIKDSPEWIRHLAFREFLRAHPEKRNEYQTLKIELAKQEFQHHFEYNAGKNDFIKATEKLALEWYQEA
ncbi:hypothetical protein A33Q_1785 [Indibacter alkaliphilus LW1]|uniref:GrpB family protein n=1 Tax=Indibacter alkaliphilus (strain CCUG 57479 / KCTC 22604 / LW1) TaxID=1189612 RepID=S2DD96_INDAL|nr:GrpB family protein [Indibacter alkaliphilus]EOZ97137.1 hypothetical protein A33Q_1785 [Indibacter alkaliphilus LW1]